MTRWLGACALSAAVAALAPASEPRPLAEPFQDRDDFESGEIRGWASYPPAQDVAFDPSLQLAEMPAIGRFALGRLVRPVRRGNLTFGAIKRTEFLTTPEAGVRFSYLTRTSSPARALHIVLCGADGARYTHTIPYPARDEWSHAEISFHRFRAAGRAAAPGLSIQAVYWELDVADVHPGDRQALYLDEVELSGARPKAVELRAPRTFAHGSGPLLAVDQFGPGGIFAPEASDGMALTYEIRDPRGVRHGPPNAGGAFRIPDEGPRGMWEASVRMAGPAGTRRSKVRWLVTDPWPSGVHPRLYVRQEHRGAMRQRMRAPETASLWADIDAHARQLRKTVDIGAGRGIATLATNPSFNGLYPYLGILRSMGGLVQVNAFVGWLTGDPEAKAAAREALLEACRWQTWTHPWFTSRGHHTYYPVGIFASGLALGYDLLYDDLSPDERELVVRALMEKAVVPSFREYSLNNRIPFHMSNWAAHSAGGSLIALLAIAEGREEAEPYFSGLLQSVRAHWEATYLPDGSYGESIAYQRFDMETSVRFLAALKDVLGTDLGRDSHVNGSHLYPLYALRAPNRQLDFGDSADRPGVLTPWAWVAAASRHGHVAWYYEQYLKRRDSLASSRRPASDLFDFLWYDATLAATPPVDLPTSRHFPDKGAAIFRSDWDDEAIVLAFTAGPFFNHNHLDQGSFQLAAFGELLLSEAGPTEYYTDEHYESYFIQSIAHNTVLVDGDPASQRIADHRSGVAALDRYPRIVTALMTDVHDQVRADLQPVYAPRLTRADRTLLFVRPHYVVLFDRLASDDPRRYSQIFHPDEAAELELDGRQARIRKGKAELRMRFLAPEAVHLQRRLGRVSMEEISRMESRRLHERAYVEASAPASAAADFLVVLTPHRTDAGAPPEVQTIDTRGLIGLRVRRGETRDDIGFGRVDGAQIRHDDIQTDARSFRVSREDARVRVLSVEDATTLRVGPHLWFQAGAATTGAARITADHIEWEFSRPPTTPLRLYTGFNPSTIVVDGRQLSSGAHAFDRGEGTIRLHLPTGARSVSARR